MDKIQQLYSDFENNLLLRRSILGCILCIIFVPLGSLVDYFLYKQHAETFFLGRILCAMVIGLVLLVLKSNYGKKLVKFLTMFWLILVSATMCWIIYSTNKYASTYYVALSVFIFSVAVILPLLTLEMLIFCCVTVLLYILTSVTFPLENANLLLNNLYLIILTSIISIISININSKYRFKEFRLNYQLKETIEILKTTRNQLIQSEKINAIGSLSAGLMHEVNNPLNYSLTAVQLLKIDPQINSDEDLKDTVKDIEDGMVRIKNIVTDLKAFAYPEEADKKVPFSLFNAIESALRFTASDCKDINKVVNVDQELKVIGSQTHIMQVLINLITNAAKAIKKAGKSGLITIEAKKENNRVLISVSDNGIGMNEETLRRVFDPFFTTSEVGEGVGMGLSISHTIIKNHNGNLSATSKLGEGSTFFFDLEKEDN